MKFATLEKIFIIIFALITITALVIAMQGYRFIGLVLLLSNLAVAGCVAVFGSLRIRDEEEDKLFK